MKPNTVLKNARLALTHRLFVPGWCLNEDLHNALIDPEHKTIYIHKENGVPVAVLLLDAYWNYVHASIFVRKAYRGKGVATKLLAKAKRKYPNTKFRAGLGIKGSKVFWLKNNVSA